MAKNPKYEKQWLKTAENKIKRIKKNKGNVEVIEKYEKNPKFRGSKKPIMKGKVTKKK